MTKEFFADSLCSIFGISIVSARTSLLLLIVLALGGLSTLLAMHGQSRIGSPQADKTAPGSVGYRPTDPSAPEGLGPYQFDERANELIRIIFPTTVYPSGYAKAYVDRARPMKFASKDDALLYHAASINSGSVCTEPFEKAREATESFWRAAHPGDGRAQELFQQTGRIETLSRDMLADKSKPTSLWEKALWQRDLICSLQAVLHCQDTMASRGASAPGVHKQTWDAAKEALLASIEQAIFTAAEFDELQAELPLPSNSKPFVSRCGYALTEDYLPRVVWQRSGARDPSFWHELPSDEDPGLHFQAYGGRSFVRIFVMTPHMNAAEFFAYWAKVTKRFGMNVTVSAAVPTLPVGTQTVLLRTFGLFLDDGSYADSRIPEEVLVRIFKYTGATLDPRTSDGLGTLHYQYKLRRHRLLNEPATLGLERVQDADGQFYGFFAEVPEPNSTEHLTTMRANCIGCHSELLYGASTIFSLCRHSPAKFSPGHGEPGGVGARVEGGHMEKMSRRGWLVKEEALHTIQNELMRRLKKVTNSQTANHASHE
jgi:hypothetical protein